ncbi:MAG: nucleoside deaminase [Acutalibacteraceae bacterium]
MKKAICLAKEAAYDGEVPVGAVIVKNAEIIACGRNRREEQKNALAHAEMEAIHEACKKTGSWRLDGCELYVTLEPCPMCAGAIINARISRVIFGAYDERAGSCFSAVNLPQEIPDSRVQIIGGYMQEECQSILTEFFKSLRCEK